MTRPTIRDLASAAGVSIATANRVIGGSGNVKQSTMQRVKEAAQQIGFYGMGAIDSRIAAAKAKYRVGFLLHQPSRQFYLNLAEALRSASERISDCTLELRIEFLDDLSPQNTATKMLELAETCDAIGVVAAVHPIVTQAVEALQLQKKPVFALISQIDTTGQVHFIGLDGWKVGRTAAWMFEQVCDQPGKLGVLVGNPRYRCQEMNESGFRSYFREYASDFTILEPRSTFESKAVAEEMTENLLKEHPDLRGLYVAGGGISGALAALKATGNAGKVMLVGYELMDITRQALLDGAMTFVISHPLNRLAEEALSGMVRSVKAKGGDGNFTSVLPFDIYTRENI
ncbi:LacI family DNA-binding transcriptional regulator [Rhizobium tubonense]|uniref:Transcriptional regulator n=1 Tax=Rhizobium tubonense TaxID=484088 RepID=A0A2W4CIV6_9HYPH|nr:LacI family DNA-binding transcriptional regulator [Rhizobium tubonense]PZM10545.1 transcriptional regulator [Rhizobium tubonense]